jgi:hypothetical protein
MCTVWAENYPVMSEYESLVMFAQVRRSHSQISIPILGAPSFFVILVADAIVLPTRRRN